MSAKQPYDIFFLVESGIGNAIEVLYAVEYCLQNNVRAGIFLNRISGSFTKYVRDCYGADVVPETLEGIETKHLVHSFTFTDTDKCNIKYEHYFYVMPDYRSSAFMSETEQIISIARSLYPSSYRSDTLTRLKENYSERVQKTNPQDKCVLFTGCSAIQPMKRWPYYDNLIAMLGEDKVLVVGGADDLNFTYSYYYPTWITKLFGRFITKRVAFFNLCKKVGLLKKHAHLPGIEKQPYAYFNVFDWPELVALLRRCVSFVGNDGGITHLAAACGAKGYAIFGPSSVDKNKPVNAAMAPMYKPFDCQPCQFGIGGNIMSRYSIVCEHQLRCLYSISANDVAQKLKGLAQENN